MQIKKLNTSDYIFNIMNVLSNDNFCFYHQACVFSALRHAHKCRGAKSVNEYRECFLSGKRCQLILDMGGKKNVNLRPYNLSFRKELCAASDFSFLYH